MDEWLMNLVEVMDWIKANAKPRTDWSGKPWSWSRNPNCKYVGLYIDMRDGGFLIKDREGNRITFEDLKRQL